MLVLCREGRGRTLLKLNSLRRDLEESRRRNLSLFQPHYSKEHVNNFVTQNDATPLGLIIIPPFKAPSDLHHQTEILILSSHYPPYL